MAVSCKLDAVILFSITHYC